jgi:predicted unusual protein kinase regulating ubiquinone biosynthesis (AarF/ABC1/UbiB family)
VKIFQAIALDNYWIDEETNKHLLKYTDQAPWSERDIDTYQLTNMTQKYNICLPNGYVPINSGMISLVFKGYLSGKPVIIKMKRKNIQQKLDEAINNLLSLVHFFSFIPIFQKYQIEEIITTNIDIIRNQTNFMEEIKNMKTIKENCKNLKYVVIPQATHSVTEEYPDIILMEYIEGMKSHEIEEKDLEPFAKASIKFGLVTGLVHKIAHGDLHCGNILFILDKEDEKYPHKIGVIDFGIVYKVEDYIETFFFDIMMAVSEKNFQEIAELMLNSDFVEPRGIMKKIPKEKYEDLLKSTTNLLREYLIDYKTLNQSHIYKFISTLKNVIFKENMSNLGIRPSDDFVKLQLVIAMAHGVAYALCKNNYIDVLDSVVNELFHINML